MNNRIVAAAFSMAAVLPFAFQTQAVHAQTARSAEPRIDGFDVAPVPRSVPGRELVFTLYGTAGGSAAVQIAGATGGLPLAETEAGVYEGTYTIRTRDHITAASKATVNLRVGNKVSSMVLDEPVIAPANSGPTAAQRAAGVGPRIEHFDVDAPSNLAAGEELFMTLNGTPGGTATAQIAGIKGKLALAESRPGVYEGSYTIKNRDRINPGAAVTSTLRVRDRETTAALGHPLSHRSQARPGQNAPERRAANACLNCGTVESINQVQVKGEGTYLGKIGGGLAGALIGSQIGNGKGTTVAEIAGAAGGVFAGNEIEKRMKTATHFEAVVRLDNGGTQTFTYAAQPAFAVGARVRADNGALTAI